MTGIEMERFYNQDERKYVIKKNKEFLKWYYEQLEKGYDPYLGLDEMQGLINKLTMWYEIKYPNELLVEPSIRNSSHQNRIISKELTIDQLKFRLTCNEREILDCAYLGTSGYWSSIDQEEKLYLFISLPSKDTSTKSRTIYADSTGKIYNDSYNKDVDSLKSLKSPLTLEELLTKLKHNPGLKLDLTELEKCIATHQLDIELRRKILFLTTLSLLYSPNTEPHTGYIRARLLIREFNQYYQLNLDTEEINEIISRDYQTEKSKLWRKRIKRKTI